MGRGQPTARGGGRRVPARARGERARATIRRAAERTTRPRGERPADRPPGPGRRASGGTEGPTTGQPTGHERGSTGDKQRQGQTGRGPAAGQGRDREARARDGRRNAPQERWAPHLPQTNRSTCVRCGWPAPREGRARSLRGSLAAAQTTKPRLHRFRVSRVVASRRCAPRKLTRSLRGARTHAHRSLAAVPANSIRASTVRSQRRSLSCGANSAAYRGAAPGPALTQMKGAPPTVSTICSACHPD